MLYSYSSVQVTKGFVPRIIVFQHPRMSLFLTTLQTPDPSPHTPFSHVTIVPFPFLLGKYLRFHTQLRSQMSKFVSGCQTFFI